ncbi:MAG: type II toxin-antitoxin system Phd/YefM family antitoxin [Deltaproteobacteria bacterium]|nr:type II toxin-antitoxin system Phd/YefM family antitoxin [Candidatus Anaeroferrophillacea bacterium]
MNTLPAGEIKRRGVKAIELALKNGPVYVIKNNTLACVILTEAEYARLSSISSLPAVSGETTLYWLLHKGPSGRGSRDELDQRLHTERESWER